MKRIQLYLPVAIIASVIISGCRGEPIIGDAGADADACGAGEPMITETTALVSDESWLTYGADMGQDAPPGWNTVAFDDRSWTASIAPNPAACGTTYEPTHSWERPNHIFTDLRDNHEVMFATFLHDLGLTEHDIAASRPSPATLSYARSFFEDFGYGTDNFHEAIAALSGRELCVSVRNCRILRDFICPRNLPLSEWLVLHETLEEEHYRDAIRPVLMRYGKDLDKVEAVLKCVSRGIERHVLYFDEMLLEYQGTPVSAT